VGHEHTVGARISLTTDHEGYRWHNMLLPCQVTRKDVFLSIKFTTTKDGVKSRELCKED